MAKGNLWNALAGMGAGFQGQGEVWSRNQMWQEDQEMREQERQRKLQEAASQKYMAAIPGANRVFLDHLNNGRINEAFQWADQGIADAQALGQDPSVWAQRLEWMGGGMVNKAIEDAAIDDREFELQGMIEPMGGAGEAPAEAQVFDKLTGILNDPDAPDNVRQAAAIKLGIDPRAATPQVIDAGGVPKLWVPQDKKLYDFDINGKPITSQTIGADEAVIASSTEAAKQAVQQSGQMFEKLAPVSKSITNINNAITQIDKGADTGAVAQHFPSFTEASVTLENIRSQMGLDIIGATTFGALSESELQFALDTAMPTGLGEKALRGWLARKRDSQIALSRELTKAAKYLGKPGNTVAGYLDMLEGDGKYSRKARTLEDILSEYN